MSNQETSDTAESDTERQTEEDVENPRGGIRAGQVRIIPPEEAGSIEDLDGSIGVLYKLIGAPELYPKYNPYTDAFNNPEASAGNQSWALMTLCAVFIVAQTLLLGHAESQAALLVGMVAIMTLLTALVAAAVLYVGVLNGIDTHTRKEAHQLTHRFQNWVAFMFACVLCAAGIALFVAHLCVMAFDLLDDEHHAIWITIFMGGACLASCCIGLAIYATNCVPSRIAPNPPPLAK